MTDEYTPLALKRYDFYCSYDGGGPADEEESSEGEYVRYEDVLAEVSREVAAALNEREFIHAESSRIYARIAGAVRAGADDHALAALVRKEVAERRSPKEP